MNITSILIATLVLSFIAFMLVDNRKRVKRAIAKSFADLHFESAHSKDGYFGHELTVLKRTESFLFFAYNDRNRFASDPLVSDIYWYCKSVDGDYFMAIALVANNYGKYEVKWVLRSLTEERMRGALKAYPEVYRAEFGDRLKH